MPNTLSSSHAVDPDALARNLTQRAHNQDGLPEIAVGLTFLLCSSLIYAQLLFPAGSIGSKSAAIAFALLLPGLCFATPRAIRSLRSRYLLGRSGYVQYKPLSRKNRVMGFAIALLMTVALLLVVKSGSQPDGWLLAGTGLFGGALTALSGRLPRFLIGGAFMAVTGLLLAFSALSLELGFTILFGLQGLAALISGCVAFLRLIRQPIEAGE